MKVTLDFISSKFKEINEKYFDGELNVPQFKVIHAKNKLGVYCFNVDVYGNILKSVLKVSDFYDRSEKDLADTVAHEMIHLYIAQNKIKDSSDHGYMFLSVAERLNKVGGFNIRKNTELKSFEVTRKRIYYVACYKVPRQDRYFRFVINRNSIDYYRELFLSSPKYFENPFIAISYNDSKYAQCLECRKTVKGYYIDEKEYKEILDNETVIFQCQTLRLCSVA